MKTFDSEKQARQAANLMMNDDRVLRVVPAQHYIYINVFEKDPPKRKVFTGRWRRSTLILPN